jgi:hypothetical protein
MIEPATLEECLDYCDETYPDKFEWARKEWCEEACEEDFGQTAPNTQVVLEGQITDN